MDFRDMPACRMRAAFEQKIMAPYHATYRGELGLAQTSVLEELSQTGPIRQQELAERLRTSKQHVSKIVNRLAELELVELSPDLEDGRSHIVGLSAEGEAFLLAHIHEAQQKIEESFAHLAPEERRELDEAMSTVVRLLEKV
ncbi:MAG: MarR family winged helix-turn-helix transcriptional regulator [Atopobiaceae bacterium]